MHLPAIALQTRLLNSADIELWPATLLRARSNADARVLARATLVLRRKRDGRYLAAALDQGLLPLVTRLAREPGIDAALDLLDAQATGLRRGPPPPPATLPPERLHERLQSLGLDPDAYAQRSGLNLVAEPQWLALAGLDRYRRPLWLRPDAARAWRTLRHAASADGIALDAISGYRSHDYQLGIFQRKLGRGQRVAQILEVNAAPGFSEHHGGDALDLGTTDEPPAEESFEATPAFAWLDEHAGRYGFTLSYPRGNPHGIVYEPWHWRYQRAG